VKRNQAQLYLTAEVFVTPGCRDEAVEALQAGLKYARRDIRSEYRDEQTHEASFTGVFIPEAAAPDQSRPGKIRHPDAEFDRKKRNKNRVSPTPQTRERAV